MKKYRCPNCKEVFVGIQEKCPKCGATLRYANANKDKPEEEEATTLNNFSFNDPEVIKHEEKFVPVTSIDTPEDKEKDKENDAVLSPLVNQPVMQPQFMVTGESFFDGKMIQRVGIFLLALLLFAITAGIAFPWVTCMVFRWDTKHTVIQGHRLKFTGKGIQLFGRFLLWLLLIVLTVGIILLWIQIFLKRWKIKHTIFVD